MRRWVGLRHLRYCWHAAHLVWYVRSWRLQGLPMQVSPADRAYLDAVWEGKA